ncbi:Undecaprenyl-phosphate glycosyltransferase, DPM1-like family OS=Geobacter metallireducens (strain GS-15 / ATCC 53774 / DSM 7210) GN=Gmet_2892 PE=4 SV=1: Glycos_transf_2 [Gemmata massiliana]|uniref:Glycosyltransferase 2-like domain-containing protein n=1 Tax=Gemmata massiliana TaxID=1210884 RepID=A0A6P2CUL6_9BACT|nr:glycosyltransferase family 2 protein [Gemmata massiliana]VTR92669.1 Undecaprenyl-phosphate glycosyltransferase, DPM1-like family OS=Geobacter metallireducens (strain GS-15 / ATCC 53774 / DSM 7210) GN=Gmet_2892 PE=4 SV=1: Glycos_transf_2 [Gemmata massiliana]
MLLSVVVPVKDERENVRPMFTRVREALDGSRTASWELVFVDDGSTDGTFTELETVAREDTRIKVVRLRRNFGQSAATQAGVDAAAGDVIVTMDGDLQNDPADIPLMIAKMTEGGYDAVLGQRAKRQDKLLLRKVPSLMANWLIRKVLGVPFKDFGCTLRAVRREVFDGLVLYGEMHRFITALIMQQGAAVTQIPVRHHPRTAGKSKYTLTRTVRVMLDLMTVKFLGSFQTRPMHLFGSMGLLCVLAGFVSVVASAVMKYTTGPGMTANPLFLLGAVAGLIGVQFVSLGLMGEVLTRVYFESQGKRPYVVRERRNLDRGPFPVGRGSIAA